MNFVCVYWGNKYSTDYVQKLYNMVERNLTIPHKFVCFTDNIRLHKIVTGDIDYRPFVTNDEQHWWNKMGLYSKDSGLEGPCLYMDLDVVILDNIDEMATFGNEMTFGVINDFNGNTQMFNSSIVKFNTDITDRAIWQEYYHDRPNWRRQQGDQNVMSMLMLKHPNTEIMPDRWTYSAKWHDRKAPRFHKSDWKFERKPEAKVAVFHGQPNPHECEQVWVKNAWF